MGANAQTTVPTFTAGQVLTADQQNQSARTGVPVFADSSARDAAFGGAGEKTLAEGQLAYLEDSDIVQYYDGSSWIAVGASALTFITGNSVSAVASFSLPNSTFTSAYRNYRVLVEGVTSGSGAQITMRLRASGSDLTGTYYGGLTTVDAGGNVFKQGSNSTSQNLGGSATAGILINFDVLAPEVAVNTKYGGNWFGGDVPSTSFAGGAFAGAYQATTSADSLSIIFASGTFTGTYRVYGYSDS